jgi:hypothetical protein
MADGTLQRRARERQRVHFRRQKYRWALAAKQSCMYFGSPARLPQKDCYIEVNARKTGAYTNASYGIVFHAAGYSYFFSVNPDDRNFLVSLSCKNGWEYILDGPVAGIQSGGVNQLAVLSQGSSYTFFVNGKKVGSVVNSTLPKGSAGLGVMQFTIGDTVNIEFDDFEVREP